MINKVVDAILMDYKLMQGYKRKHISPRCAIQMDVHNAYDTVEWTNLERITYELNFLLIFINWIMVCITIVSYRYSINGQVTDLVKARCGLCQGGPISPMLFVMVIEYLHRCLRKLNTMTNFNFHPCCEKLHIVNISFVDDLILFAHGDELSVKLLIHVFRKFSKRNWYSCSPYKVQGLF